MPRTKGNFWNEFEQISNENNESSEQWRCLHCGQQWVKNASRLSKHLENCKKYQDSLNQSEPLFPPPPTTKRCKMGQQTTLDGYAYSFSQKDQEEMEKLLARAFYSAGISFNIIDNPDFCIFLKKACSAFKIPSRHKLSTTILDAEYNSLKKDVDDVLEKKEYLCITSDGWSNIKKTSIINYMVTIPQPIFYKSIPTHEERHTAENISAGIKQTINEVGEEKVVAIITDNAPNMKAAWEILKNEYPHKVIIKIY
jgi:hypothetical protein